MSDREWYVENTWTCTSCQSSNRGRDTRCVKCGSPKETEEAASEVTGTAPIDTTLLAQAKEGAHKPCAFCESLLRTVEGSCGSCGAAHPDRLSRDDELDRRAAAIRSGSHSRDRKPSDPPSVSPFERAGVKPATVLPREEPKPKQTRVEAEGTWKIAALIGGGALLVVFGLVWLFTKHPMEAKVADSFWVHTVRYEKRLTEHESGWGARIGAFNTSCETRLRGYVKCQPYDCDPYQETYDCRPHSCNPYTESYSCDPYKCNCSTKCTNQGNGFSKCRESCSTCYRTCTRTKYRTCYDTCSRTKYRTCYKQCPDYAQWCEYDYYRWVANGELSTSGHGPNGMGWPDRGADETHRNFSSTAYVVHFTDGKDKWSIAPRTIEEFRRYVPGDTWIGEKAVLGSFQPLKRKP